MRYTRCPWNLETCYWPIKLLDFLQLYSNVELLHRATTKFFCHTLTRRKKKKGKIPFLALTLALTLTVTLSPDYSATMLVHCFFLMMSLNIPFHIACQWPTSEMDIDGATLAAAYIWGYSIFRKDHEYRLSWSLSFTTRVFLNSHVMSQWFQNIGTKMA